MQALFLSIAHPGYSTLCLPIILLTICKNFKNSVYTLVTLPRMTGICDDFWV